MGVQAAPRIDRRLVRLIGHQLDETPAALTREVGRLAERLGLCRPSYQQVRVLRLAALRRAGRESGLDVRIRVAVRVRPAAVRPRRWYRRVVDALV